MSDCNGKPASYAIALAKGYERIWNGKRGHIVACPNDQNEKFCRSFGFQFNPMFLKKILYYLDIRTLFRPNEKKVNANVRFMNGMNRISIFMFLFALTVLLIRYLKH